MAKRYSGDLIVTINYHDDDTYRGVVRSRSSGATYKFTDLHAPAIGLGRGVAYDSATAYDKMARAAISFASYDDSAFEGYDTMPSGEARVTRGAFNGHRRVNLVRAAISRRARRHRRGR